MLIQILLGAGALFSFSLCVFIGWLYRVGSDYNFLPYTRKTDPNWQTTKGLKGFANRTEKSIYPFLIFVALFAICVICSLQLLSTLGIEMI